MFLKILVYKWPCVVLYIDTYKRGFCVHAVKYTIDMGVVRELRNWFLDG